MASGDYRRSQLAVRYSDGTETFVNGSRDGEWMEVRRGGGKLVLPPYGFFGESKGACSFYGSRAGVRVAFARGPEYAYMFARDKKWFETPGGGTDGDMVRLFEPGGTEEIIEHASTQIMLPYAAVKIVVLDVEGRERGQVPFKVDERGRTTFQRQKGAYSYRATPPAGWTDPDASAYAAAARSPLDAPVPTAKAVLRKLPLPYVWRSGMVMRGSTEEIPVDRNKGSHIGWSAMVNEGVTRSTLSFHPPYRGGKTGCVFARYRIKIPQEGLVFTAKTAKARGTVLGDGILFRVLVREKAGTPAECAAEMTVKDYVWHDFRADLSRWAGRSVELILVGDPGLANNTFGDGGGWADMRLEREMR